MENTERNAIIELIEAWPSEHITLERKTILELANTQNLDVYDLETELDNAFVGGNFNDLIDGDSAEFSIDYQNKIVLDHVDLNWSEVIRIVLVTLEKKLNG